NTSVGANGITVTGNLGNGAMQSLTLSTGSANVTQSAATTIQTNLLTLASTIGSFGTSSAYILANAPELIANTSGANSSTGNVFVNDSASTVTIFGASTANNFNLIASASPGSILLSSSISASGMSTSSVSLTATGSGTISSNINSNVINATGLVTIQVAS